MFLWIKLRKLHSLTRQQILPIGNEYNEDLKRFCTSFYTCSKCIPRVSTYVGMGKPKYYAVEVKKKYRHLYFPSPKHKKGQIRLT